MNILIIGSGGREHALAWKIKQSKHCNELFIAPGNAGTSACGTNLDIKINDFETLKHAALQHHIEMIVVGPEDPLVNGIYDYFTANSETKHIQIVGPSAEAAQLEGSKAFAKAFMQRHDIPTASYKEFNSANFEEGLEYINNHSLPIVLKADGLAAGKGVLICTTHEDALYEFDQMIRHAKFGKASNKVVIESFLKGIEVSVFAITDGKSFCVLPEAKDYKRIGAGDTGLNTGGMGAVSPVPFFDETLKDKIVRTIIEPTISGFEKEKLVYKGFVFFGLMIDNGEPYVIEYNCRMGDPETEVVIPRIKNDLVELLSAIDSGNLNEMIIVQDENAAATTFLVSGGYPGNYLTEKVISGLNLITENESLCFHSGTKKINEKIVTNGGRVIAVTDFGKDIKQAVRASLATIEKIKFDEMYFRSDIGFEFVS
jgi:phosphoribosylamine--glycine ligase